MLLEMAQQCGYQLLSKLRCDAALYLPYTGSYSGHGPHRTYGEKLDAQHLPPQALKCTTRAGALETRIYQAQVRHKAFNQPLNVVILVKTNLHTKAHAHLILFTSDLSLSYDLLVDYYSLRFQIEFNFRDAKQSWGLEDFMNVTEVAVTNAANLSLFMVNFSYRLLRDLRLKDSHFSILDLKACFSGAKYVTETIQLLPQKPEPILLARIFNHVTQLGPIHPLQSSSHAP